MRSRNSLELSRFSSVLCIQEIESPKVPYAVLSGLLVRIQNWNNQLGHSIYGASWPRA
jgi:hypothetical protein